MFHVIDFIDENYSIELLHTVQEFFDGKTKKTLDDNEDKNIHGTEYDLNSCQGTITIKTIVEEVASLLYDKQLICCNYWTSISESNTTVMLHDHMDVPYNLISAVLYLQADPNCGRLYLSDYEKELQPETGQLVLFPSNCKHSVSLNRSLRDRICIAFDLKLNI